MVNTETMVFWHAISCCLADGNYELKLQSGIKYSFPLGTETGVKTYQDKFRLCLAG